MYLGTYLISNLTKKYVQNVRILYGDIEGYLSYGTTDTVHHTDTSLRTMAHGQSSIISWQWPLGTSDDQQ